ncbi:MAG: SsrA-binding protein SmpB [Candidatus Moranbacteria bacterium]|nr:SsrA-binding protein SmpB [Candidatus Moranbacteria bacterium]
MKPVVNKKARYHYEILEDYEAGMVLSGAEVKSIKNGNIDLKGAYVSLKDQEPYLINARVPLYQYANDQDDYDASRDKKLLLNKKEIKSLIGKLKQKGLTLLPIKVYTRRGRVKLKIALVRGKTTYDKRQAIKKRDAQKEIEQRFKNNPL